MVDSRSRGSRGELQVIKIFKEEFGDLIPVENIRRNLTQYQQKLCCDIIVADTWACEVKNYKSGSWFKPEWWAQTKASAAQSHLIPILFYKFDRTPFRCVLPLYAINKSYALDDDAHSWPTDDKAVTPVAVDLETGLMIMREWM